MYDPNQQQYYGQQPGFNPGYPPQGFGGQPGFPQPGFQQPGFGGMPATVPFHMPPPPMNTSDDGGVKGFEFDDQSIRKAFIRKVYSILMCQLLLTLGFIVLFKYHTATNLWVRKNQWLFYVSLAVMLITMISMACCTSVRRTAPMNFVFLGLFTMAQGFLLGCTTIVYRGDEVMLAVAITAVVCFSLTIFAFQTKWDFTVMGGVLFVAVIILMLFGLVAIFFPGKTMSMIYGCFGAILFSVYLIYDTQLMMGGKHKYSISPEEYIFASLNLYLDIVNIFLYILTIIGASLSCDNEPNPVGFSQPPMNQMDKPNVPPMIGSDEEGASAFLFDNQTIRRAFIRKVYSLLMCQLLLTLGLILLFQFHGGVKLWVMENDWIVSVSFLFMFITLISMSCCVSVRRQAPMNIIFLGLFTGAQGFTLGTLCSFYNRDEVIMAVGITAIVCFSLTVFAFQSKWDFTVLGGLLFVSLICLILFGILAAVFPSQMMSMVYSFAGAILFSLYLIHDTQIMIGGKHKYSISPEEYIFAALNLYLDIVNLFLIILRMNVASPTPPGYSTEPLAAKSDYPQAQADYPPIGFQQPGFAGMPGTVPFRMPTPPLNGSQGGFDEDMKQFDFNDQSIRRAFIRKVYSILMCQLMLTLCFILVFKFHKATNLWTRQHPELFMLSVIVMFVTLITMACCGEIRRKTPHNFIFLGLFTLAQGFMLGCACTAYQGDEIMLAIGITAVVCFSLTVFAFQTKWDFTIMGGVLFVALICLIIFGLVGIFFPGKTMSMVYGFFGAILFSFYLIYDTQKMMGGEHKYSISPEEYIFAALNLYLDIINLFLHILRIIAASRN
uniref:CSON000213 protein n=1 Tax=Culicoides sonorensis TaxID=179676 RepID=A0A336LQ22_CULSO